MPLLPPTLTEGLIALDVPPTPPTAPAMAQAWHSAWWSYFSGMVALNPATLPAAQAVSEAAFVPTLIPGLLPVPAPGAFFIALETAITLAIAASTLPAFLDPLVAIAAIPAPPGLAALLLPVVPIGLISPTSAPPRVFMATAIDLWTRTNTFMPPPPATVPLPFT